MAHPAAAEDSALIQELMDLSREKPKLVRASNYAAPADRNLSISSWKMAENKYYVVPSPFPTLARGVFSLKQPDGQYRIVARGYDKFFNIGEVGWTTWAALEAHTTAPYTLSLKSNGCIIFIAALTPEKLLITSKHAVGPAKGEKKLSHADAGEAWLRKYLAQKGRTEADLAGVLSEKNWTAVAELCDDSFEEHVLAYPAEMTGLHLHGLNESTKAFKTQPHAVVDAFAEEWGFIKTASTELPTVAAVRAFTTEVSKTGAWNGVPVEGFVVRTQVAPPPPTATPRSAPPYPSGASFFFKVKFDEPYMMYRDWREVTKTLLGMRKAKGKSKSDGMSVDALPKSKMRRAETQVYARWVIEEIRRDPDAFAEYNENKGIVAVRERFLAYLETDPGKKALKSKGGEHAKRTQGKGDFGKTIIVPVAIPGCGKTAVAVALSHIFGFGHTQSDDVNAKKSAPIFIKNVTDLLKKHEVVIADKNNHLQQHRQALRDATASFTPPVRLLALNWALDAQPLAAVHRLCADRIQQRGANHQTLRPDSAKAHEDVLWTFLTKADPLAPSEVDEVVEMELADGLDEAVGRAVDACVRVLGLPPPSAATVETALARARGYEPKAKRRDPPPGKNAKAKEPRYFALLPEVALEPLLAPVLADVPFWTALQGAGRVAQRPHVTLVHENALKASGDADAAAAAEAQQFWTRCKALHDMGVERPPLFRFRLGHVVWNERIMAVTVDGVELAEEADAGQIGAEFVAQLPAEVRQRLHITVGTRDANVPAVEAKAMVETWRQAPTSAQSIPLGGVVTTGRAKGLQK